MTRQSRIPGAWFKTTFRPTTPPRLKEEASRHGFVVICFIVAYALLGEWLLSPIEPLRARLSMPALDDFFLNFGARLSANRMRGHEIPVTLVKFDEEALARYPGTDVIPRCSLPAIIDRVASAKPAAIVVDMLLSADEDPSLCAADPAARSFDTFLEGYDGPPLVLARDLRVRKGRGSEELQVQLVPAAYEAMALGPTVRWMHAFFEEDGDGVVRRWRETWNVCAPPGEVLVVDSAPVAVMAAVPELRGRAVIAARSYGSGECGVDAQPGVEHRMLFAVQTRPSVSVARLLTHRIADADVLTGRVVVIGVTHSASSDDWLTPVGNLPGVELIAQSIRFAPLRLSPALSSTAHKAAAIAGFMILAASAFFLRPAVALGVAALGLAAIVIIGLRTSLSILVLDAIEHALWLFLEYEIVIGVLSLIADQARYGRIAPLLLAGRFRRGDTERE